MACGGGALQVLGGERTDFDDLKNDPNLNYKH
jgi:hypothetical protein